MTAHSALNRRAQWKEGKGAGCVHDCTLSQHSRKWKTGGGSWLVGVLLTSHHPHRVTSEQDQKEGKDTGQVHELTRHGSEEWKEERGTGKVHHNNTHRSGRGHETSGVIGCEGLGGGVGGRC